MLGTLLVRPDHCELVAILLCPSVNHIKSEVEELGYLYLEVAVRLLVVLHIVPDRCRRVIDERAGLAAGIDPESGETLELAGTGFSNPVRP